MHEGHVVQVLLRISHLDPDDSTLYKNFAIKIMRLAPSMGNSKKFALLVSEDPSDKFEYTSGLVFLGSFYLVFFFMWTLVLILCKWMGPENVGLWSGHEMQPVEAGTKSYLQRYKVKIVRAIFGLAAFLWMVFVIVFLAKGLNGLEEAKVAYDESSTVSNNVATKYLQADQHSRYRCTGNVLGD